MAGVEKPGGDVPAGVPVPPPEGLHLVVLGGGEVGDRHQQQQWALVGGGNVEVDQTPLQNQLQKNKECKWWLQAVDLPSVLDRLNPFHPAGPFLN